MNILDKILVVDVNVIIHLEKVGLLDELINDKNIRIVDLVLYEEYEFKKNKSSAKVEKIKQVHLNEKEMAEAHKLYQSNPRNSVFDYYSYIIARDNNYALLTGDWKLKKKATDITVHGVIWYVQMLNNRGIIDSDRLKNIYEEWLINPSIFINSDILSELLFEQCIKELLNK